MKPTKMVLPIRSEVNQGQIEAWVRENGRKGLATQREYATMATGLATQEGENMKPCEGKHETP